MDLEEHHTARADWGEQGRTQVPGTWAMWGAQTEPGEQGREKVQDQIR